MYAEQVEEAAEGIVEGNSAVQKGGSAEPAPKHAQETAPSSKEEEDAAPSSQSSPRRPLTRSQTGTVAKRRKRDDSEDRTAAKKRAPAQRKKAKTGSPSEPASAGASPDAQNSSASPRPPTTREPSMSASSASGTQAVNDSGHQLTFFNASPSSSDQQECRLPRSRATLPTPIPNLTKKSRGRRVPTQASGASDSDQKDQRLYVCKVDGCGKCFHRGEHLKRHIRSIHTHEKPFKCTFPLCQKYFNRHDNLLQHLKVHRDEISTPAAAAAVANPQHNDNHREASRSQTPPQHDQPRRAASVRDDQDREGSYEEDHGLSYNDPISHHTQPRTIYNAFSLPTYGGMNVTPYPYSTPNRITNLAVSSLRTELPMLPSAASRPY